MYGRIQMFVTICSYISSSMLNTSQAMVFPSTTNVSPRERALYSSIISQCRMSLLYIFAFFCSHFLLGRRARHCRRRQHTLQACHTCHLRVLKTRCTERYQQPNTPNGNQLASPSPASPSGPAGHSFRSNGNSEWITRRIAKE
jgi:hypothetical protein